MKQKLYIKTYGCQMNVYDSAMMSDVLKPFGYEVSETYKKADMVILNTCHIREKATEKTYSELGRIKQEKELMAKSGKKMIIAVAGCVAQAEGEEIFKRAPFVDMVVGPQSIHTLPDLVSKVNRDNKNVINLELVTDKFDKLPEEKQVDGYSAFLSVQEGCDKFCTFCVVPYTRGAEYSRTVESIYRDAMQLVSSGVKEINLLGQNVNGFHGTAHDGSVWNLGMLIKHLANIKGLERIRYTTSHPIDMHEDLYDAHKNVEKLMPFLHLPIQAGSDRVLKAMNRKHDRDFYFKVIDRLMEARPDIKFSSDIIVGFPGETDKDFEQTLDLVKRVGYSQCYSFKYSERPGTPGADMEDQVPEEVKSERLKILQELLIKQQNEFNNSCQGKTIPVLFEKKGRHENQLTGKTPFNQSVHVTSKEDILGTIKNVHIDEILSNSMRGFLVGSV